jgi:hypothetical protein
MQHTAEFFLCNIFEYIYYIKNTKNNMDQSIEWTIECEDQEDFNRKFDKAIELMNDNTGLIKIFTKDFLTLN